MIIILNKFISLVKCMEVYDNLIAMDHKNYDLTSWLLTPEMQSNIHQLQQPKVAHYRRPTKLREGNVSQVSLNAVQRGYVI